MKTRYPAVAGAFYPASPKKLREVIENCLEKERARIEPPPENEKILGGVVPHAGYMYSGCHAVHFFESVRRSGQNFDTVVIVNPNHTGFSPAIALDDNQEWETPLGKMLLDTELSDLLPFERSGIAHSQEHSGEVMVPFLQYFLPAGLMILPLTMSRQTHANAIEVAGRVYNAANTLGRSVLFIASSDFSHFLPPEEGYGLDELVVREVLALNAEGVEERVKQFHISVCGYGPIMALIEYSKRKCNSPVAKVLRRGNSGEVSPSLSVVDYVTMLFFE